MARASGVAKAGTFGSDFGRKPDPRTKFKLGSAARKRFVKVSVNGKAFTIRDMDPVDLNTLIQTTVRSADQSSAKGAAEFTVTVSRGSLFISDVRVSAIDSARVTSGESSAPELITARPPENEAAFASARERGRHRVAEILESPEMLSGEAFGERFHLSRVAVNAKRKRHEFLGLQGTKRGYRYPDWQIKEDGQPLAELPRLFEILGDSPWVVYRFLLQSHPEMGDRSALDELRDGNSKVVLDVAEAVSRGDFA